MDANLTYLGGSAEALATWETIELTNDKGEKVRVTGMPAVHASNPEIRGAVGETMGFLLEWDSQQSGAFYITDDTVWIDEIRRRFDVGTAIPHMGAALV